MRFVSEGVCLRRRYCGPMFHALHFPANQVGGHIELCVIRGYAFSEVCVMRDSTVYTPILIVFSSFLSRVPLIPAASESPHNQSSQGRSFINGGAR
jgi:hypothetical protein